MSPIKLLNNLLFVENIFGIYRNYCTQKKLKKHLIVFHTFIHILLYTIIVINEVHFLLRGDDFNHMNVMIGCFSVLSYIICLSSIVTGFSYSRAFISYLKSISRVSEYFKHDNRLKTSIKKIYWFSIAFVALATAFSVYRSADILVNHLQIDDFLDFLLYTFVPAFISHAFTRITIVIQKLMLFVVIMIVCHLTKCLNSVISAVQESVGSCDISSDEQRDITREKIHGWVELYRDLANCCEKVTLCFGRQFIFSLSMSASYYILLTHHMCKPIFLKKAVQKMVYAIFSYVSLTLMPIAAGQMTRNQGINLHRKLARLYNTIIVTGSSEVEAKLLKDFIRLIKKSPLEIKLLSNIPAGMYMLPAILALTVNCIIVMMQFNNVF